MKSLLKILLISSLLLNLTSCVTQKRCNSKFPPEILIKDSTQVELIYRDTVITDTILIAGEKIILTDTIPCNDFKYKKEIKKNNVKALVSINNGILSVECKTDSIKMHYQKVIKNLLKSKTLVQTRLEVKKLYERYIPWWIYTIIGFLLSIISYLVIKLYVKRRV